MNGNGTKKVSRVSVFGQKNTTFSLLDTWDKEKHEDILKFPMYTNRHNIVIQLILRPGDILHYSHDKRAIGEFPFSIGGQLPQNN